MEYDSPGMCDIDTIGDIAEEEETLYPTHIRTIGIEELLQIIADLYESLRKGKSCLRLDHSVLDDTDRLPFFFEKCKSSSRSSWIDAEENHGYMIQINRGI
jgi:hypothetical protein